MRAPRGAALRVLVVDDDADSAVGLAEVVKLWGHFAVAAFDGASAMRQYDALAPDVVLLDITLPDVSGYDLAKHFRSRDGSPVRLVAVSGHFFEGPPGHDGFDDRFVKPVDLARLRALLGAGG